MANVKSKSQMLEESCGRLGIQPDSLRLAPRVGLFIRQQYQFDTGEAVDYIRMSGDARAKLFLKHYDKDALTVSDHDILPLEAYCLAADIPPMDLLEIIVGALVRTSAHASAVIAAIHQPQMVARTVEDALGETDRAEAARTTLFKATGFLPSPKGSQTTIPIYIGGGPQQGQLAAGSVPALAPPAEATVRRTVDLFNAARSKPEVLPIQDAEFEDVKEEVEGGA